MSETAKYNAAFRVAQEMANNMKSMKHHEYEMHLNKLLQHSDLILKRVDFEFLIKDNESNDKTLIPEVEEVDEINENNEINDPDDPAHSSQSSIESNATSTSSVTKFNLSSKRSIKGLRLFESFNTNFKSNVGLIKYYN
jgi:hypothetical protein